MELICKLANKLREYEATNRGVSIQSCWRWLCVWWIHGRLFDTPSFGATMGQSFHCGEDSQGPGKDSAGRPFYGPYDVQNLESEIGRSERYFTDSPKRQH